MAGPSQSQTNWNQNVPRHILERNCTLSIRDLHSAEKQGSLFCSKYNKTPFLKVLVCGKIINAYQQNHNECLVVDDGTAEIICIIDPDIIRNLESTKNQFCGTTELCKAGIENNFVWGSVLLSGRMKKELNMVPNVRTTKLKRLIGQVVFVTGKLRKYEKLFLFIEKIKFSTDGIVGLDEHLKSVQEIRDRCPN